MAIEVFNRFENKYLIPESTLGRVLDQLENYMEKDKFNKDESLFYPGLEDKNIQSNLTKEINKLRTQVKLLRLKYLS